MIDFPNAKINLGINVVSRREDGYHNIETIFYPIGLKDALEIVPTSEGDAPYRFFESGLKIDGDIENNLVIKALRLVKEQHDIPPIDIYLHKVIPFGAGLGGGSANAASMLKLLNNNYELGHGEQELIELATKLGADCPFFIKNKPSYATGIGDKLKEVDLNLDKYTLVLVKPDIWVNTGAAYSMITPQQSEISLEEIIKQPIEKWRDLMKNDFEEPIFKINPQICDLKQELYDMGALYASMSGSGSSVYAFFDKTPDIEGKFENHFVWTNMPL